MSDEIQFSNMDSWKGGSSFNQGLNFKQICLQHINRCVVNGSVEFRGGYSKQIISGNYTNYEYIPDTRDVYNNSIRMLRALLLGYFDEELKRKDKELQLEYDERQKEYSDKQKEASQNEDKGSSLKGEWYKFKIEWHIRLFEQLVMLSKRLNFFEEESSEGEEV